jgi:hypothetical protein
MPFNRRPNTDPLDRIDDDGSRRSMVMMMVGAVAGAASAFRSRQIMVGTGAPAASALGGRRFRLGGGFGRATASARALRLLIFDRIVVLSSETHTV